jgi:membrane protein DedA with SNARE-associated domain
MPMNEPVPRSRRLAVAFAVMLSTRTAGIAVAPALFAFAPLLLIVISPFVPNLVMAAPVVHPVAFFAIVFLIAIPHCWLAYAFGRAYGPLASRWIVQKTPTTEGGLEWMLGATRKSAPLVLMALPGPLSSTLAGVAEVPRRLYATVMVPTQIAWFLGSFYLGESLVDAIKTARGFAIDNVVWLTAATVLLVALRQLPSLLASPSDPE